MMKPRSANMFIIGATCIVAALIALSIAGYVDLGKLKEWQALIAAGVAIGAAAVAWRNVQTTLRANLMSREEDRLDRDIAALLRAYLFVGGIVAHFDDGKVPSTKDSWENILRINGITPGPSHFNEVERLLSDASSPVRMRVAGYVNGIEAALAGIHAGGTDIRFKNHIEETVAKLNSLRAELLDDIRDMKSRKERLRAQITSYFEQR